MPKRKTVELWRGVYRLRGLGFDEMGRWVCPPSAANLAIFGKSGFGKSLTLLTVARATHNRIIPAVRWDDEMEAWKVTSDDIKHDDQTVLIAPHINVVHYITETREVVDGWASELPPTYHVSVQNGDFDTLFANLSPPVLILFDSLEMGSEWRNNKRAAGRADLQLKFLAALDAWRTTQMKKWSTSKAGQEFTAALIARDYDTAVEMAKKDYLYTKNSKNKYLPPLILLFATGQVNANFSAINSFAPQTTPAASVHVMHVLTAMAVKNAKISNEITSTIRRPQNGDVIFPPDYIIVPNTVEKAEEIVKSLVNTDTEAYLMPNYLVPQFFVPPPAQMVQQLRLTPLLIA